MVAKLIKDKFGMKLSVASVVGFSLNSGSPVRSPCIVRRSVMKLWTSSGSRRTIRK